MRFLITPEVEKTSMELIERVGGKVKHANFEAKITDGKLEKIIEEKPLFSPFVKFVILVALAASLNLINIILIEALFKVKTINVGWLDLKTLLLK